MKTAITALAVACAAAALYMQNASASVPTDSTDAGGTDGTDTSTNLFNNAGSDLMNLFGASTGATQNNNGYDANLSAFLYMLRMGESSNRYNVRYPGVTFSDYSRHPDVWAPLNNGTGLGSTAAGAYEFIFPTWSTYQRKLGLPDFSPASQDAAAVQYLTDLGAMPYIEAGDVEGACAQINSTGVIFESLVKRSQTQLQAWYSQAGGALA